MSSIEELIAGWDGEAVVSHYDRDHGTWMFVGVHSTRLGPACGGTRMRAYPSPADALQDVLRLASGMTLKCAAAGLPTGGGKAVLAVPELPTGGRRRDLLLRYGRLVDRLGGTYRTGPDMNTTGADMDVLGEVTDYAFGRSPGKGGRGTSAPDTALGVWHGIRASCEYAFGSAELGGRTVLVQGAGGVGGALAGLLAETGAKVMVADLDAGRVADLQHRHGVIPVDPAEVVGTECDVYAPCATGSVLAADTIPALRCRVVAGAANNQLATAADAERLEAADILYAPDFVINSGGALHLIGLELCGWDTSTLSARLAGIGTTLTEIYRHARAVGITTEAAAEAVARSRLDAAPARIRPGDALAG
ncbi:MAG TPA: Glu/Leu/Phe/Val dehydrogenase dimerization domain-containing protein [Mycobacteriales bacterium]|nr:Glu/Leu/Phe/Val dehydrogenase dimerization domain-containing protein [Mycobacteriales bacterium]